MRRRRRCAYGLTASREGFWGMSMFRRSATAARATKRPVKGMNVAGASRTEFALSGFEENSICPSVNAAASAATPSSIRNKSPYGNSRPALPRSPGANCRKMNSSRSRVGRRNWRALCRSAMRSLVTRRTSRSRVSSKSTSPEVGDCPCRATHAVRQGVDDSGSIRKLTRRVAGGRSV